MSAVRPFTVALVLANVIAFLAELAGGVDATCQAYGLVPAHFALSTALTSLFLHAGWAHLLGNMACLVLAGAVVERELGGFRFLALYLAAGVAGGVLHTLTATDTLVGASGAIFGLLPVVVALRPRLVGFVGALAALNVWYALAGTGELVSFGCHLGGLAAGVLFAATARATGALEAA